MLYDVFIHQLFVPELNAAGSRSGETGIAMDPFEFVRLRPCLFETSDQTRVRAMQFQIFQNVSAGSSGVDLWKDGFESVKNYLCALFSLERAGLLAVEYSAQRGFTYDAVVALRPDLAYVRDVEVGKLQSLRPNSRTVFTPDYQTWGGINDRFAMGGSAVMLGHFTKRREGWMRDSNKHGATNGETYLKLTLFPESGITNAATNMRAMRVRATGKVQRLDTIPMSAGIDVEERRRCIGQESTFLPDSC